MSEKFRVTFDENHKVVGVEMNKDGKWITAEKSSPASAASANSTSGGCGEGAGNCPGIPGYIVYEIMGQCYYFPC